MTNESGIGKLINMKTIATSIILVVLGFSASNILAVRDNTKAIQDHDEKICEAKTERKELKTQDEKLKEDQQKLLIAIKEMVGELKVTNERVNQLIEKTKVNQ